jgi:hypothetical protein
MCNPLGTATNHIVDWSVIEQSRADYQVARVHFEHAQIIEKFGEFNFVGTRWVFSELHNDSNPNSHCDIAWAGGLATHAHIANRCSAGGLVG